MQKQLRKMFDGDQLIIMCRIEARARIAKALKPNGQLDWSKLPNLVTVNRKLELVDESDPYMTAGVQLAPSHASGYNTCANANGCAKVCLFGAGHGQRHMIHDGKHTVWIARIVRTILFYEYRDQFMAQLIKEMQAFKRKAARKGYKTAFRPNVISDIDWIKLGPAIFDQGIDKIYDYAKVLKRLDYHSEKYHITLSRQETTSDQLVIDTVRRGINVAVVFSTKKGQPLPKTYLGLPVFDADATDNRFNDPVGVIAGLRVKNTGKVDQSGFVVQV
jgi:hypothetical protein